MNSWSIADLHDRLGELVERLPETALPRNRPGFGCSFNGIDPAPQVDIACAERLQLIAASAREEMGEERWAELNAEWSLSPEQRAQKEKEWQS